MVFVAMHEIMHEGVGCVNFLAESSWAHLRRLQTVFAIAPGGRDPPWVRAEMAKLVDRDVPAR
jgi:hypothetical protein